MSIRSFFMMCMHTSNKALRINLSKRFDLTPPKNTSLSCLVLDSGHRSSKEKSGRHRPAAVTTDRVIIQSMSQKCRLLPVSESKDPIDTRLE